MKALSWGFGIAHKQADSLYTCISTTVLYIAVDNGLGIKLGVFEGKDHPYKYILNKAKARQINKHISNVDLSTPSWKTPIVGIEMSVSIIDWERWTIYWGTPITRHIATRVVMNAPTVIMMLPFTLVTQPLSISLLSPPPTVNLMEIIIILKIQEN